MSVLPRQEFLVTIEKFGQDLCDIDILLNRFEEFDEFEAGPLDFIINGCPNLEAKHLRLSNNITCKPLPQYLQQGFHPKRSLQEILQ